jgi:hypothetical protein
MPGYAMGGPVGNGWSAFSNPGTGWFTGQESDSFTEASTGSSILYQSSGSTLTETGSFGPSGYAFTSVVYEAHATELQLGRQ